MLKLKFIILCSAGALAVFGAAGYTIMRKVTEAKQNNTVSTTTATPLSSTTTNQPGSAKPAAGTTTNGKTSTTNGSSKKTTTTGGTGTASGGTTTGGTTTGGATPTPPPTGGNVAAGSCYSSPSSCGYPDATNTGPLAGTTFINVPAQATSGNGWEWNSSGYVSVFGSNVTVNGLVVSGGIDITGSNVTVQNCKVSTNNDYFGISARHTTNVTIRNCNVSGANTSTGRTEAGIKSIYGDDVNFRMIANNVYYVATGIQICQGIMQDNYIHDLGFQTGDHLNGMTSNSGCDLLTVQHNTIFNSFSQTDAISLFEDFGAQYNALITNNFIAGGGYSIYGGANSGGVTPTNVKITNNRVSDHYYANGGYWGWLAAWDGSGAGNVCSGNVLEHSATGTVSALGC